MFGQTSWLSIFLAIFVILRTFEPNTVVGFDILKTLENSSGGLIQRTKRQFNENNINSGFGSGGDGGRRRSQIRPGAELIFSSNNNQRQRELTNNNNNNNIFGNNQSGQLVFINNRPTIATVAPFTGRTTASPQYLSCFNSCRTTSEYNPICGSDQELYFNEQKFNCARFCGADIQIVRRGSCQGLFPMERG